VKFCLKKNSREIQTGEVEIIHFCKGTQYQTGEVSEIQTERKLQLQYSWK